MLNFWALTSKQNPQSTIRNPQFYRKVLTCLSIANLNRTVWMEDGCVKLINQPLLPHRFESFRRRTPGHGPAIREMVVRGGAGHRRGCGLWHGAGHHAGA